MQHEVSQTAARPAYVMTALQKTQMPVETIMKFFSDQQIENLKFSEVVTSNGNIANTYSFEHNNFREFPAARFLTQLSERIFEIVTFAPLHRRIKPRWMNTLAFIYELLEPGSSLLERLHQWIFRHQPEALLEREPDKISCEIRAYVFRQIVMHRKSTSGYVFSQQTHPDKLVALVDNITDFISFLLQELQQTSGASFQIYKRHLLYIMMRISGIGEHQSASEIKDLLWKIGRGKGEKGFTGDGSCWQSGETFRAYRADKYVDFLIESVRLREKSADTAQHSTISPGYQTRSAILELRAAHSVLKVLRFFRKNIHLFRVWVGSRYHFDQQFQQDFF